MLKSSSMGAVHPTNKKLRVGDQAPDFSLPDPSNRPVLLPQGLFRRATGGSMHFQR